MKIASVAVWDLTLPFRDGTYVMSHVSQDFTFGRLVEIRTDDGFTGWGEIVFPPSVPEPDRLNLVASEPGYLTDLVGKNLDALKRRTDELASRGKTWGGVAFGLDTAWHDIIGKQSEVSVAKLLSMPEVDAVNGYVSISERTPQSIQQAIIGLGQGAKVIQLKVGIAGSDQDIDHIAAALAAMRDNQVLLVDANGRWTMQIANVVVNRFDDPRIVWEEPFDNYEANAALARSSGKPVMVDQCVAQPDIALRAADEGIVHSICIKPAFLGGLAISRRVLDACIAKRRLVRIDGPWCGDIASAAILHLALGTPAELLVASADLRSPLLIEPDLHGVRYTEDGLISPPNGPGLGLAFDSTCLGPPTAIYGDRPCPIR